MVAILIVIGVLILIGAGVFGLWKLVTSKRVQKDVVKVEAGVKQADQTVQQVVQDIKK